MNSNEPLISVIMPCYNSSRFVKEAIESVVSNSIFAKCELIIINDGSTDDTELVIRNVIDNITNDNIIYVKTENRGVSAARNTGLELSRGILISFIDSDDVYSPFFLETLSSIMLDKANIDLCFCHFATSPRLKICNNAKPKTISTGKVFDYLLYRTKKIGLWTAVYRKSVIMNNNICFSTGFKYGEDIQFLWRFLFKSRSVAQVDGAFYYYRLSDSSAMSKVTYDKVQLLDVLSSLQKELDVNSINYSKRFRNYSVPRAILSLAKDYALSRNLELFRKIQEQFRTVKKGSLLVHGKIVVRMMALLYIISPKIFYLAVSRSRR